MQSLTIDGAYDESFPARLKRAAASVSTAAMIGDTAHGGVECLINELRLDVRRVFKRFATTNSNLFGVKSNERGITPPED
jgi:hypothetical protein